MSSSQQKFGLNMISNLSRKVVKHIFKKHFELLHVESETNFKIFVSASRKIRKKTNFWAIDIV